MSRVRTRHRVLQRGGVPWSLVVLGTLLVALDRLVGRCLERSAGRDDRGDVPGWVLVTLMTAGLVTSLWILARDRLTAIFDAAITSVTG